MADMGTRAAAEKWGVAQVNCNEMVPKRVN